MDNFNLIVKLLGQYGVASDKISRESTLKELNVDSLDLVEIIVSAEQELQITFDDEELLDLKTVGNVVDLLNQKTNR